MNNPNLLPLDAKILEDEIEEMSEAIDVIDVASDSDFIEELTENEDVNNGIIVYTTDPSPMSPDNPIRPIEYFDIKPIYMQQQFEDNKCYSILLAYMALPAGERSLVRAYNVWKTREVAAPPTWIFAISKFWRWKERAHLSDIHRANAIKEKWIERDLERREEDWAAATKLRQKGLQALYVMLPENLDPQDTGKFLELASKLQSQAIPNLEISGAEMESILSSLPEERRSKIIRIVAAEFTT